MTRVFIDGSAGTTGLRIRERLELRRDIALVQLPEEFRKDVNARAEAMGQSDVVFLCLPDDAAREAVTLAGSARVIDTSTAHRTLNSWDYGFPELHGQREKIAGSKRVANPGCHASGFIALVEPLVREGLLDAAEMLTCFSVTGYSGGGKKMIAEYETENRPEEFDAPRQYALGQSHKHLPEMQKLCGLETAPVFCPIVADYYSGMCVTVPLFASQLKCRASELPEVYRAYYSGPIVKYSDCAAMAAGNELSGRDDMLIGVAGNEARILLISRFDNLGKGASGAAIQNMNLLLGAEETTGLVIGGST